MAKKKTWKEITGLKQGDTAYCDGTIQYNHRKYNISENVTILEIKSNSCYCIIDELDGKQKIKVSILKKYLSNPKLNNDKNKTDVIEKMESDDNIDTNEQIDEKDNSNNQVDITIDTQKEQKNEESTTEEELESINESETKTLEDALDKLPEMETESDLETVTKHLHQKTDDFFQEIKNESEQNNPIKIPSVGFREYPLNNVFKDLIKRAATLKSNTILRDPLLTKERFNELHILKLKELYAHVPTTNNPFHPKMCYKLVCQLDFTKIDELDKYLNRNITDVELEIFIKQENLRLDHYTFKVINHSNFRTVVDLNLTKLQEAEIEIYGKRCAQYYEELIKEESYK